MNTIASDAERLFAELHKLSFDGVGITRPTYSKTETDAMMIIHREAVACGLKVGFDSASNLHVSLPGHGDLSARVMCGSHLDSVPNGGNYDGAAGVVAGLLALRDLAAQRERPHRTITLVALRGEESAWFGKCYLGSLALFGKLNEGDFVRQRRHTGKSLADCMDDQGASVAALRHGAWIYQSTSIKAYLELHIEQGPVLDEARLPLGIVTGIRGNVRHNVKIVGEAGHSGTVPMRSRHDAVAAFAQFLVALRAELDGIDDLVHTVGRVHTDSDHDSVSAIADIVEFTLEWRSLSTHILDSVRATVTRIAAAVEAAHGVKFIFDTATVTAPVQTDPHLEQLLARHAWNVTGASPLLLPSGAGHDAAVFAAEGIPTGMLFVRNQHGSHNPNESMNIDDFALGTHVLKQALLELANE